jgi:hypothetical protein
MAEAKEATPGRAAAIGFGAVDLLSAVLLYLGVFRGLPARYWLVDVPAFLVIVLFAVAGGALLARVRWAPIAALVASIVSIVLGLALITTLALTASYLSGIYGPIGRGGAMILTLVAAMALPYLVGIPLAQLAWVSRTVPLFHRAPRGAAIAES